MTWKLLFLVHLQAAVVFCASMQATAAASNLLPGPFDIGGVGFWADETHAAYAADVLMNRDIVNFWAYKPICPEYTAVFDISAMPNVTLSVYEDFASNAGSTLASYQDGTHIATFAGTASVMPSGVVLTTWQDSFPFVDAQSQITYWDPQAVDFDIRFTYLTPGDANGDGWINTIDYAQLDAAYLSGLYNKSGASWINGDYNRNGRITEADYAMIGLDYSIPIIAVPEPGAMGLVLFGLAILARK